MRIKRVFTVTAAIAAVLLGTALPASATSSPTSGHQTVPSHDAIPRSGIKLPGGLRAIPETAKSRPQSSYLPSGIVNLGTVRIANYYQDAYVITVQPSDSNGRLANHLYMWNNNDWSTQQFNVLKNDNDNTFIFESLYNNECINVPGASNTSGVQMIVYSCAGYPVNESFVDISQCIDDTGASFCDIWRLYYNSYLALGVGSNFFDGNNPTGGNGAWVISTNDWSWKAEWVFV
jgi:hypothetical protein